MYVGDWGDHGRALNNNNNNNNHDCFHYYYYYFYYYYESYYFSTVKEAAQGDKHKLKTAPAKKRYWLKMYQSRLVIRPCPFPPWFQDTGNTTRS